MFYDSFGKSVMFLMEGTSVTLLLVPAKALVAFLIVGGEYTAENVSAIFKLKI